MEPEFIILKTIDSTNLEARRLIAGGKKDDFVIISENQTAGRGRLGRTFYSSLGGLYMSIVISPKDITYLTSKTAVDVCSVLEEYNLNPKIKWVNDIYLDNRKICGILCEKVGDRVIVGIGVNTNISSFPDELSSKAGSIFLPISVQTLGRKIAAAVMTSEFDFDRYDSLSLLKGKEIAFSINGKDYSGLVKGNDKDCGLIVQTEDGEMILRSGEVTITSF